MKGTLDHFLILSDGVGVDIAAWLLHGKMFKANLNGTDFVPALLRIIAQALKVGLIGAKREVVDAACVNVRRRAFRSTNSRSFPTAISSRAMKIHPAADRRFRAGHRPGRHGRAAAGTIRQRGFLDPDTCTLPIAVGALFDLYTGTIPRAPEWMRSTRTEWVFRLWKEPERLWRRYVMGNPLFMLRVLQMPPDRPVARLAASRWLRPLPSRIC